MFELHLGVWEVSWFAHSRLPVADGNDDRCLSFLTCGDATQLALNSHILFYHPWVRNGVFLNCLWKRYDDLGAGCPPPLFCYFGDQCVINFLWSQPVHANQQVPALGAKSVLWATVFPATLLSHLLLILHSQHNSTRGLEIVQNLGSSIGLFWAILRFKFYTSCILKLCQIDFPGLGIALCCRWPNGHTSSPQQWRFLPGWIILLMSTCFLGWALFII